MVKFMGSLVRILLSSVLMERKILERKGLTWSHKPGDYDEGKETEWSGTFPR